METMVFESNIRRIGSDSWLLRNTGMFEDRPNVARNVAALYATVLGLDQTVADITGDDPACEPNR